MCQCTHVQNHVYASEIRCTYVCDIHQLTNAENKNSLGKGEHVTK